MLVTNLAIHLVLVQLTLVALLQASLATVILAEVLLLPQGVAPLLATIPHPALGRVTPAPTEGREVTLSYS